MGRRILLLLVYSVMMAMGARLAAAQQWVEIKSPHFSVVTDAGERRGREVADRFEQMRASFGILFKRLTVNIPVPLQIVAFRNQKEFRQFAPLWKGKPVELSGLFQGGEDRNFIAMDVSSDDWGVAFHEYGHLLINGNVPPTPLWFDEGLADYLSSLKVDKKQVQFGLPVPNRVAVLGSMSWMKLLDLLSVQHDSRQYNEGEERAVFYAQSWLLVHYFMANGKMPQLTEYLALRPRDKASIEQAIRQSFRMEPKQLDDALHGYFRRGSMAYFFAPAPDISLGPYQVRMLPESEWRAVLADFHYHSRDHMEQGVTEFKQVLAADPNNAAANRGLGYAALEQKDFDRAAEYFRRAAASDSTDPRVHYFTALLMNKRALETGKKPDDVAGMRREIETAIALNPNYADAYNLLAYVESVNDKYKAARAAAAKAVALDPRNEYYRLNEAQFALRAEDFDGAEKTLKELKDSANPAVASTAGNALEQLAMVRAYSSKAAAAPADSAVPNAAPPATPAAIVERPSNEESSTAAPRLEHRPIQFLKGKLLAVDCSAAPAAAITISSGGKKWTMFTQDSKKLILIGVDAFSCGWHDRGVFVNYRVQPDGRNEIVSLEVN